MSLLFARAQAPECRSRSLLQLCMTDGGIQPDGGFNCVTGSSSVSRYLMHHQFAEHGYCVQMALRMTAGQARQQLRLLGLLGPRRSCRGCCTASMGRSTRPIMTSRASGSFLAASVSSLTAHRCLMTACQKTIMLWAKCFLNNLHARCASTDEGTVRMHLTAATCPSESTTVIDNLGLEDFLSTLGGDAGGCICGTYTLPSRGAPSPASLFNA